MRNSVTPLIGSWLILTFIIAVLLHVPTNLAVLSIPQAHAQTFDYSTSTLRAYALMDARDYRINGAAFVATLQKESNFKWDAVGDHGTSIGVAQFHYPSGAWGGSTTTALNPLASIDMAAQLFAEGYARHWTGYRIYEYGHLRM